MITLIIEDLSLLIVLHEQLCKNWEENIFKMPKLRTYVKFKKRFEVEPYILSFMNHKRSYLAQFRSMLPLQIEVGWWANENVEERLYLVCNESLMEDEQHFIFHCNYYNPERCDFFAHMTKSVPNFMDLTEDEKLHNLCSKKMYKNSVNTCVIYMK